MNSICRRCFIWSMYIVACFYCAAQDSDIAAESQYNKAFIDSEKNFVLDSENKSSKSETSAVGEKKIDINDSGHSSSALMFRLVVSLLIICLLAYAVIKFFKRSSVFSANDDPYLKSTSILYLAQNKTVQIVTLGDRAYLIGVTDSSISKIAEIHDKELVDAMNLNADKSRPKAVKDFADILGLFFPQKANKEVGNNTDEYSFLSDQSDRLRNIQKPLSHLDDKNETSVGES